MQQLHVLPSFLRAQPFWPDTGGNEPRFLIATPGFKVLSGYACCQLMKSKALEAVLLREFEGFGSQTFPSVFRK